MNKGVSEQPAGAKFQPLYAQVKSLIMQRIGSRIWKPGELIPNEFELAAEFNVSQGTVRKALISLEADNLIVRRQGRGTYVARHTGQQMLLKFRRIVGSDEKPPTPSSKPISQTLQVADKKQAGMLGVNPRDMLHVIARIRFFEKEPVIFERIFVPVALMPDLAVTPGTTMVDEMYVIYQERFKTTIARASEKLRAVTATLEDVRHLSVAKYHPLLEITRIARDVNGKIVELRVSHCNTARYSYATEVV